MSSSLNADRDAKPEYIALLPYGVTLRVPSKRYLLLFDRILQVVIYQETTQQGMTSADHLELEDAGLYTMLTVKAASVYPQEKVTWPPRKLESVDLMVPSIESSAAFYDFSPEGIDCVLRMIKTEVEMQCGVHATPIVPGLTTASGSTLFAKGDVAFVTINALPLPAEDSPIRAIVEFKQDEDARGTLLALRRWITQTAHSTLQAAEIAEELEYLLQEYERHLALHRMKFYRGALTTAVAMAAEALENVLRLRFSKVFAALSSFDAARIDLLEAEMKAPGREVAYVHRAREHFHA